MIVVHSLLIDLSGRYTRGLHSLFTEVPSFSRPGSISPVNIGKFNSPTPGPRPHQNRRQPWWDFSFALFWMVLRFDLSVSERLTRRPLDRIFFLHFLLLSRVGRHFLRFL